MIRTYAKTQEPGEEGVDMTILSISPVDTDGVLAEEKDARHLTPARLRPGKLRCLSRNEHPTTSDGKNYSHLLQQVGRRRSLHFDKQQVLVTSCSYQRVTIVACTRQPPLKISCPSCQRTNRPYLLSIPTFSETRRALNISVVT